MIMKSFDNMDTKRITIEQQKQIQLDILKSVDCFCRDNSIDYSIAFGTLLGAVRHRGFIPWDDDVDIMMTRENYEKFRSLYKSKNYPFVDLKNDETHPVSMGKVYDSRTYFYYKRSMRRKYGLFIDVFPFDRVPEDTDERMLWLKKVRRYITYNYYKNNTFSYILSRSSIKKRLFGCIVKFFASGRLIHKKLESLYIKYQNIDSGFLSVPAVMVIKNNQSKLFPESLFDHYISIEFEGVTFQCIKDYDKFLKIFYGDYMQLPPVEQRVGKHGIVAYFK